MAGFFVLIFFTLIFEVSNRFGLFQTTNVKTYVNPDIKPNLS